jgi:hypothetical protein
MSAFLGLVTYAMFLSHLIDVSRPDCQNVPLPIHLVLLKEVDLAKQGWSGTSYWGVWMFVVFSMRFQVVWVV